MTDGLTGDFAARVEPSVVPRTHQAQWERLLPRGVWPPPAGQSEYSPKTNVQRPDRYPHPQAGRQVNRQAGRQKAHRRQTWVTQRSAVNKRHKNRIVTHDDKCARLGELLPNVLQTA
jgi:hypothetical protein